MDAARVSLAGLAARARLSVPDELPRLFTDAAAALGARSTTVYLVDHEQMLLVPIPGPAGAPPPLRIEGTLAGRCFRQLDAQRSSSASGTSMWLPVLDGLERLGVVELTFDDGAQASMSADDLDSFAAAVAELVLVKSPYGDLFHQVRRRRSMSLAAEIAWHLLPPLTFGTDRLVISTVLAPAYEVGGDSFDYAVDSRTARFAVFDAMGHGLGAGLLSTVAIGAYRNARRQGSGLTATADAIDTAIAGQFAGEKFVTGVMAELDLASGRLNWHNAGHPLPLLLRSGRVVKTLYADPGLPLGLGESGSEREMSAESLEPGDRLLLFTDGVVEARSRTGDFFGLERFADFVVREDAAGQAAPETLRRLIHAVLAHQAGDLQDDATAMLVEWQGGGTDRILPDYG